MKLQINCISKAVYLIRLCHQISYRKVKKKQQRMFFSKVSSTTNTKGQILKQLLIKRKYLQYLFVKMFAKKFNFKN